MPEYYDDQATVHGLSEHLCFIVCLRCSQVARQGSQCSVRWLFEGVYTRYLRNSLSRSTSSCVPIVDHKCWYLQNFPSWSACTQTRLVRCRQSPGLNPGRGPPQTSRACPCLSLAARVCGHPPPPHTPHCNGPLLVKDGLAEAATAVCLRGPLWPLLTLKARW